MKCSTSPSCLKTRAPPELSLQALGPLAGQRGRVGGRHVGGAARPRDVEGVEAEPDLTDLAGDLADREEAGRGGLTEAAGEVGVVDAGCSPAAPTEGAAHTEARGALTQGRPAQSLALRGCIAGPVTPCGGQRSEVTWGNCEVIRSYLQCCYSRHWETL